MSLGSLEAAVVWLNQADLHRWMQAKTLTRLWCRLVRLWCVKGGARILGMRRRRRLRRLVPDGELLRRRLAGEPLRELAPAYGVAHTTLGRYFERPEVQAQLRQLRQQLRGEQRARAAARAAERRLEPEIR